MITVRLNSGLSRPSKYVAASSPNPPNNHVRLKKMR